MPQYACRICGRLSDQRRCPRHRHGGDNPPGRRPDSNAHRSPNRDRAAQARFRRAVLKRAGNACERCGVSDEDLRDRGETLRAHHVVPLADGGDYDPANGQALCPSCDRRVDPYAR